MIKYVILLLLVITHFALYAEFVEFYTFPKDGYYKLTGSFSNGENGAIFVVNKGNSSEIKVALTDLRKTKMKFTSGSILELCIYIEKRCAFSCEGTIKKINGYVSPWSGSVAMSNFIPIGEKECRTSK